MKNSTIFEMYFYCFIFIALVILFIYLFITKKMSLNSKEAKKIMYPLYAIIIIFLIIGIIVLVIPPIRDIPYVINHNYCFASGIVTRSDGLGGVTIIDSESGKLIDLELHFKGIQLGDHLNINYLPYSKNGTIIDGYSIKLSK